MSEYEKPFEYSQEWYEEEYHKKGDYNLLKRTWDEVQGEWNAKGHHSRFIHFLQSWGYNLNGKNCVDIGCHHAKSMAWCLDEYPGIEWFSGMDFSHVAIDWCRDNFPKHRYDRAQVSFIRGNVSNLARLYARNTFDVVFCVDMIEHIPERTYREMIQGIKEIAMPHAFIVCQIGKTPQPEHIHIISDEQAIEDFDLPVYFREGVYFVLENVK